jgi:radical SAM protein with 4Fe4S-binding SPASM domain
MRQFFLCYFETTRQCNRNCRYCMSRLEAPPSEPELTAEEIKRCVLDEVKRYSPDSAVAFSGGEFLMRSDALELLTYNSARLGLWSFINTNGSSLTKERVKEIAQATGQKAIFVFPLNSIENKIHFWSRDDDVKTLVNASKACLKNDVPFFFLTTISKMNLGTLKATIQTLQKKGVPVLRAPFVLRGAGKHYRDLCFTRDDMEKIIYPTLRDNYLSYVSYTPFFASPELVAEKCSQMNVILGQLGCQAAKGFIGISTEGEVAPCVQLLDTAVTCGNVRRQSLYDILHHNELLRALRQRDSLKGKCGRCRYRPTCGGCRALAYYQSGDCFAEDPTCFFEPVDEHTRSEHEPVQNQNTERFIDFLKQNKPWASLF